MWTFRAKPQEWSRAVHRAGAGGLEHDRHPEHLGAIRRVHEGPLRGRGERYGISMSSS